MDLCERLEQIWLKLRLIDRKRLEKKFFSLLDAVKKGRAQENSEFIRSFLPELEAAEKRSLEYCTRKLFIEYPEKLPITEQIETIRNTVRASQVVIVCGATGSGKTTQLPKIAVECGCGSTGLIGCTQPRRLAATALASRFADETRVMLGREVGYQIRFDDRTDNSTAVKFMTDGILLAETRNDPDLLQYDCLILDEVHERSLNIDFLLGYLKQLLARRSDIKIIISSATLESERISQFFNDAPVIEIPGGLFPIEDIYMPLEDDEELSEGIFRAAEFLGELDPRGDILVFLPGEREIRECCEYLAGKRFVSTEILPLFGRLSASEQERVFKRSSKRRIVLATNVAETSVTIPGIKFVIDSGLVRLSRFNPRTRIQELLVERVSQASARQRRGRCGRLSDGVCVKLYTAEDLENAPEYTAPEIQRTALSGVILQMAALRLPPIEEFPLLDPPSPALIREGVRTLTDLHAVTSENPSTRQLTREGARLAALPVDPHIGSMLLASKKYGTLPEMLVTASYLSISDPRERPFDKPKEADAAHKKFNSEESDFLGILKLYYAAFNQGFSNTQLRNFCKQNYLNFRRMREWKSLAAELASSLNGKLPDDAAVTVQNTTALHKAILSGIPRQVSQYDKNERLYRDMNGRPFSVFPGSGLAKLKTPHRQIMYFTIMETRMRYARLCAVTDASYLLETAPHLCKASYSDIHYDRSSGFVYAKEKITCGALTVVEGRRIHYAKIDPAEARKVFLRDALAAGDVPEKTAPWVKRLSDDLKLLRDMELKMRRPESIVNEEALFELLDRTLPDNIASVNDIKEDFRRNKSNWNFDISDFVYFDDIFEVLDDYPDELVCGNIRAKLIYNFAPGEKNDGMTLLVKEDDLPLFNAHLPDYLVPGWLDRKVEIMLKSLPKSQRRYFAPTHEAVTDFCSKVKSGSVITNQSLADSMMEYLANEYSLELAASAFDDVEYPEFLVMKIAVTDNNNKVKAVHRSYPDRSRIGNRLAGAVSAKYGVTNRKESSSLWPSDGVLEYEVTMPDAGNRKGYPALCIEDNKVASAVFLDANDAEYHHKNAIVELVKRTLKEECSYWVKKTAFSNNAKLTLFLGTPEPAKELLDAAILASLEVAPEDIRSESAFELALESAKPEIGANMSALAGMLENQCSDVESIRSAAKKLPGVNFTRSDIIQHLKYLYRPGFLKVPEAFANYPRYLKSLALRVGRASGGGCAKDEQKAANIIPWIERFFLAAEKCDISANPQLTEFYLLLEEARISAFTPELRTNVKSAASKLEDAWNKVRLK